MPVVMLMPESTEALAIAALKAGVTDYLQQPVIDTELMASIDRCVEQGADNRLAATPALRRHPP